MTRKRTGDQADEDFYKLYLEERRELIHAQQKTAESFDKALLTLASGAFTVSLVFIKEIVPKPNPTTLWSLGWSWGLFAGTLLAILIGFLASQEACRRQVDVCESELLKNQRLENGWVKLAQILNWSSIGMLASAFFLSGVFVYLNYLRR